MKPITETQGRMWIIRDKRGRMLVKSLNRLKCDAIWLFLNQYPDLERGSVKTWEDAERKGYTCDPIQIIGRVK